MLPHDLCSALRSARERLSIAQTHAVWPGHRHDLQTCLDTVDRIGVFSCPDWSKRLDGTAVPSDEYLEVTREAIDAVAEKEGRRRGSSG